MQERPSKRTEPAGGGAVFVTTHWSMVLRAGKSRSPEATDALETLCRAYWPPLYAYVRRRGYDAHHSQDLIQEFFTRLLESKSLGTVDPVKGKFRSFLLGSMNHFLANEWDRAQSQKRGGGCFTFSLDQALEDGIPGIEAATESTPERDFEKRWAETLIKRVLDRLREEWAKRYQPEQFDVLKVFLIEERGANPFAPLAARLGMSEAALKSVVHRLRKRYRELFREEIAQTVSSPGEVEDEIRHLFAALGN